MKYIVLIILLLFIIFYNLNIKKGNFFESGLINILMISDF